jgi:isopenicillin-N N-acyltransferase like protein
MTTFRYPEAAAHGGRLEYHGPIPILTVGGTPEQIGRQVGELALRPAARLLGYPLDYLRSQVRVPLLPRLLWALLRRKCRRLYANVSATYRAEVEGVAAVCPDSGRLVPANTLFDMSHMGLRSLLGCSSLVVPPHRSATGGTLLGRNLDFFPLGYLHEFSLVAAYRPFAGRLGFASLGFPGLVGCFSGMNEAGLWLVRHEVLAPSVRRTFDPSGVRSRRPSGKYWRSAGRRPKRQRT